MAHVRNSGTALDDARATGSLLICEVAVAEVRPYFDTDGALISFMERSGIEFRKISMEGATLAGTCEETRKVIDALGGGPALSSCWDVNNGLHCGEMPMPDGYAQIKGLVTHVHVKPNRGKNLNPIGETNITYEDIFQTLLDDGFSGAASIEHWGSPELMLEGVRQLRVAIDGMS